ncbi:MAG: hypothetical protein M3167_02475 [Acidobacteriota bacterium]|nr:hypothetical protein [Acidobacteriota bacterium]
MTKSGKTAALALWIADGLLRGEAVAWIGPWSAKTRSGYDRVKEFIAPAIAAGVVRVNDSTMRMRSNNGGSFEPFTGDNAEAIFGDSFRRIALDEASRQGAGSLTAAWTTISATEGRVRIAFNVERGRRNWAVAGLLRVQAMSAEERAAQSEDFVIFGAADGFVPPEVVDAMRRQMPAPLFEALYRGVIPEADSALFRNLDQVFTGRELAAPEPGRGYVAGIDLARKQDWTVIAIADSDSGAIVAADRFQILDWSLQVERCAALYRRFECSRAVVDASGIGDVVVGELERAGLTVEPFIFTKPSRKQLLERLVVACEGARVSIPASEGFRVFRAELESFEYLLDGGEVRYAAPAGQHSDCVMATALALKACNAFGGGPGPFRWAPVGRANAGGRWARWG